MIIQRTIQEDPKLRLENVNYTPKTNKIRQAFMCLRHASDSQTSNSQITRACTYTPACEGLWRIKLCAGCIITPPAVGEAEF